MNKTIPPLLRAARLRFAWLVTVAALAALPSWVLAQSQALAQWTLTSGNAPTYVTTGAGITAGPATLRKLSTASSNPYTFTNGQSFAPDAAGAWSLIGGTLKRAFCQQFTITTAPGTTVARVDSLILNSAFYGSASNIKMAVVYSKTGFTTNDSTEITGGTTNNGAALTYPTASVGNFNKAFSLLRNDLGPNNATDNYRLALKNNTGIALAAGQTLSIRLYYSCGSGSTSGVFAMLKNVTVKGQAVAVGNVGPSSADISFSTLPGGYTYAISTSPTGAGISATQTTAPTLANNYVATYALTGLTPGTASYTATVTPTPSGALPTALALTSASFATPTGTCANPGAPMPGNITQSGATVSFTGATGSTGYILKYSPTATGTPVVTHNLGAAATSDNLTGLVSGTDYTVTLQSTCANGTSALFSTSFTTLVCADPSGLTVANSGRTSTSAVVSFVPGASNASYALTYYPTGSPVLANTATGTGSPVTLTGLSAGTSYTVTLQSTCSNGATSNVLSTTFATRVANSTVLQSFPLTADEADDATARAGGVAPSAAALTALVVSDGTSSDGESGGAVAAYSTRGMAVAPTAGGTGWNVGSTALSRYVQFEVAALAGGSLRVDSLIFNTGGYGTTATLAVAYSTDNFATSTFILGSAASYVAVNKVSSSGYTVVRQALAGNTGLTLAGGSSVVFRLYYAIGSSNARHALTKGLYVTGLSMPNCPSVSNASISNVSAVRAQLNFTPSAGNTAFAVTLTPQGGSATTISPAPTASPVLFTGLSASTTYTVTVQTMCGSASGYTQNLSFTTPAAASNVLQQWPMTAGTADNAAVRSFAVTASTSSLSGLIVSNNSTSPPYPDYSATYGQAIAPAANGGSWSSTANSGIYEEFAVTAAAGDNIRVDSLVFSTAQLSSANGKLAVAYSTNNFATSTFVMGTGLTAPAAITQYAGASGLPKYAIALAGGVTCTSGQTLKFRFYYASGSTSSIRYVFLRNVYVAGEGFVNNLPNLTIDDTQTQVTGSYGNVTVLNGGTATLSGPLTAQGLITVQNGGVLNTACQPITGTQFTLNAGGELQICDPAGISASGSTGAIQVTGTRSFSPDAIYTYTGAGTQATGSGLPATVRTLKANLASAADTLQLGSNVTVNTAIIAARGVLKTYAPDYSSHYLLTMGKPAAALSETSTSFVLGQVQTAALSFVAEGNSTGFGNIGLSLTAHTANGASLAGSTYVVRTTGTPVYGVGTSTSIRRQYRVVPTVDTNLNMDLTFSFSGQAAELNGIPQANLQLFSRPIAGGLWRPEGGTVSGGTVSLTGLDHLSDWTLGNRANPLPVELSAFAAVRQDQAARLTWTTATERNNKGFAVQASTNGREFHVLGFVPGAGSSTKAQAYRFVDETAGRVAGTHYYRLQQLDFDGSSSYTAVRSVTFGPAQASELTASPNPFGDVLTVNTTATEAARVAFALTDAAGRPVLTLAATVPAGAAKTSLRGLGTLRSGFYVLGFVLDGKPHYLKVVKE
jgi:hypothetical protein